MTVNRMLYRLLLMVVIPTLLPVVQAGASNDPNVHTRSDGVTIVDLNQTPCLFLGSEENPRSYTSMKAADCIAINAKTAKDRKFKTLHFSVP